MKKIINITLGGLVFAIEQDAYDALAAYLSEVKEHLLGNDDYAEIIEDIERALSEKFVARKRSESVAVTGDDVGTVISEMGVPSAFGEENIAVDTKDTQSQKTNTKKRLFRDTDDAIIAGVASGLANYFDIDPVIVRIIFFASVFFNGLGILAYLILWLVVPKAETTTEKYAMRGEKMTIKEITQRVKKNIESVDTAHLDTAKGAWAGVRPTFVKMFEVLGLCVRGCLRIARYIAGFVLLIGGALTLAGLVSTYSIVLLSEKMLLPTEAQTALDIMLSSTLGIIAISASFVMMAIPMMVLILAGGSLVMKRTLFTVTKSITFAVVWIVAMMLATTTSMLQVEQVMQELGLEHFENGEYNIHINVDDDGVYFDTDILPPQEEEVPSAPPSDAVHDLPIAPITACTMDAKICPDGSAVGRTGPYCEFTKCPDEQ